MGSEQLRAGVRDSYRVHRKIRLAVPVSSSQSQSFQQQAQDLLGFNQARFSADAVILDYDAGYLQIDSLIGLLKKLQLPLLNSRWQHMRLGWFRYQDGNIRDASRDTSSSCCSQSPLRHR